ncbi:adenylate cyclase [Ruegeria marisrubri]|uniref:Adenylate cyclase n=1 Tax=Ruegeria marisrubri TaxID=1685379 RepID=A0A0X3TJ70_9RHOB|nr:DUF3095 domain-containing protein [Ruegeria marisrubri]KUJ73260.1 adenylate cyclase [Ruegeria marisrubri]
MRDRHDSFYEDLTPLRDFARLADPAQFQPVPQDWVVGVADIVDSTGEIERGRYKTVNMVGAAVIAAMINALEGQQFPFVFGGDGAAFAIPQASASLGRACLATLRRWAQEEFDISLRAAVIPVADIRAAGRDLRVARFAPSDGVDYAMFSGGGLAWAEARMKAGDYTLPLAAPGTQPDLEGLSCRWSNSRAQRGQIVSLVVQPTEHTTEQEFAALAQRLVAISEGLERGGHPVPPGGPPINWPPPGLDIDAHVSRKGGSLALKKLLLLAQNLFIWSLFKTHMRLGSFDPDHYRHMVSSNADFRKFDDGLKMTLDCDQSTLAQIRQVLEDAREKGQARFGMHVQQEAMMTCFVPSAMQDDHVHFVDGASGGYARAAAAMKQQPAHA